MDPFEITWEAPEYFHYKRSNDWFWAVGIITVCISVLAFIFNNSLFGVMIIIAAIILVYFAIREPEMVKYAINNRGVKINKTLHPFITLESYWLEVRHGEPKLILKSKKNIQPYFVIPVHEDDVNDLDIILNEFIEEKELQEPTSHKVMEYLGF